MSPFKQLANAIADATLGFNRLVYIAGRRVAYKSRNSARVPEQAGLVHDDKGTVSRPYVMGGILYVLWDKGFEHVVSLENVRVLDLLEELIDEPSTRV
ncbi:MAG: hypothetical protein AB7L09_02535 [Nitrospira sp.]